MLKFNPADPFPLLEAGLHSYLEAQEHSARVDAWLGLRTGETEGDLKKIEGQELWVGLPIQTLMTPYTEIRTLLHDLQPALGETIVDLGAGYGRMAWVIGAHHPGVHFVGYEYVAARVEEARRCLRKWSYPESCMRQIDLSDPSFVPMAAEHYFLYDYGTRVAIEKTLQDLRMIARERSITVIGRGRSSRDQIERQHPWLSQVVPPRHFPHYSIYQSC